MMNNTIINVVIADDLPLLNEGLASYFSDSKEIKIVGKAKNYHEIMSILRKTSADVAITDIRFKNNYFHGPEICKRIKKEFPQIKVIAYSDFLNKKNIDRMKVSGANAIVDKANSPEILLQTIKDVVINENDEFIIKEFVSPVPEQERDLDLDFNLDANTLAQLTLTDRELQVLKLIGKGLTNKEIFKKLKIEYRTVTTHKTNIRKKLGVHTDSEFLKVAMLYNSKM